MSGSNRELDMDLVRHLIYCFPEVDFVFIGAVAEEPVRRYERGWLKNS